MIFINIREKIRRGEIKKGSLRKLRHPSKIKKIMEFLEAEEKKEEEEKKKEEKQE